MSYFPEVDKPVPYEGPDSKNPLAFRYYDKDREVAGKRMSEHLKFAVCYWHTMRGTGADVFGGGSFVRPWGTASDPMEAARSTMDAAFELFTKLGVEYYCFHDRDIAPEGSSVSQSHQNLQAMVEHAARRQNETGVRLLWGTANLFSHPRFTHGQRRIPTPSFSRMRRLKRAARWTPPSSSAEPATFSGADAKAIRRFSIPT